ncbi:DUF4132 domain-containing protein [Massilia niabensis]|uniref:DUF4132 domain-containing protein n=1 Tax=Massilia niabensis TaxID=544910 RepID=A0ABW0L5L5_9BURK
MLKSLLGVLDTARNILSPDTSLIRQVAAPLAHLDAALAARAAGYLADGSDATVLLDLRRHAQAGDLLGKPGRLRWNFHAVQDDKQQAKAIEAGMAARHALYRRIEARPADMALLMRMGRLLEAADQGQSLDRAGSSAPDWLAYVLNDAFWACMPNDGSARDEGKVAEARPAWDIRLLRALLDEAGLPQAMALNIVFERRAIDSYYQDQVYRRLLAAGPLDDDMLARPDDVASAAQTLSAIGRVVLVKRIGGADALRAAYAGLLMRLAVSDSKTVRAAAARHLDALDRAACHAGLAVLLREGQGEERANAAELLARVQGDAAGPVLEAALAQEPGKAVQQAIRLALSRIGAAADAADIGLPDPPPLPPLPEVTLADDAVELLLANREQLLEHLRLAAEEEQEENRSGKHKYTWRARHYERYRRLGTGKLRDAVRALNGDRDALQVLADDNVNETLGYGGRLEERADFGLLQALRWHLNWGSGSAWLWSSPRIQAWLRRQDPSQVDLRHLRDAAVRCGAPADAIALECLRHTWSPGSLPQAILPPEGVWPCLAGHPDLIDEGLGMAAAERGRYQNLDLGQTLAVLGTFPTVPARWLPRVLEFALGETKLHRQAAQRLLGKLPDIGKRVADALQSNKQELRIEAARWLARMDYRAAVPALYTALDKETREPVSAELMTALEILGEDITARLAPEALLAQALKGLKARAPAGLAWLKLEQLPACAWQDAKGGNGAVDPEIVRWWVILAAKLKEPAANALLVRYLGLLDAPSRAALGRFLLHAFIGQDTAHPPLEEAIAWAGQHAPARYQQFQQMAKQYPDYYTELGEMSQGQVFELVKREKLGEYLGSAIGEKGILALTCAMPGHEAVDAIRQYMRDHYPRRAQIEAMLEAAAVSDDPAVIQFVLSIARRYRTASVQQKARVLVERIAERNGWTEEQLADRTIPTGGLDESGRMSFQYGARELSVVLDDKLKIVLQNAEGKAIAALPAARQNDAPEAIKEGKQLFTSCKKEVKQVLDMQTARLYEAMCASRAWPAAEWTEYVRRHPIVGRLAQRLAWTRLAADGSISGLFRPTEDGSLIDAEDEEVSLDEKERIGLAHASLLDEEQVRAWLAHFKDYKVAPLFSQLTRRGPVLADPAAQEIDDRLGWTSDTFTLRGAFNKLGYQRGSAEDGGVFMEYTRDFANAGLQVRIEFSGSSLPEENMPAALKTLEFVRIGTGRGFGMHRGGSVALGKVPPVLLAEAYCDYHAVAAACQGFDPDWERKMPW